MYQRNCTLYGGPFGEVTRRSRQDTDTKAEIANVIEASTWRKFTIETGRIEPDITHLTRSVPLFWEIRLDFTLSL